MKYELDQVVYYLKENHVHSAAILARMQVESLREEWGCTAEQKSFFTPFGKAGVFYQTCHGTFSEKEVFVSREDLARSLV